jgi:hypothetical protein
MGYSRDSLQATFNTVVYLLFKQDTKNVEGHAVAHLVEALPYKWEGRGFDFRWFHWNFFIDIILPAAVWLWG